MGTLTVTVRVKPGASRVRVGGSYGEPPALVVAVSAPPVDGRANEAVTAAVADALALRPRQVRLVSGHTARTKVLDIDVDDADRAAVAARLGQLLAQ